MIKKLFLILISVLFVLVIEPNINTVSADCIATGAFGDCSCSIAGCDGLRYAPGLNEETGDPCRVQESCNTTPNSDSCGTPAQGGSCNMTNHNSVSCGSGSQCTGVLGDGCGYCQSPVCNNNGFQDNGETGVDCGGGGCGACAPSGGGGSGGGGGCPTYQSSEIIDSGTLGNCTAVITHKGWDATDKEAVGWLDGGRTCPNNRDCTRTLKMNDSGATSKCDVNLQFDNRWNWNSSGLLTDLTFTTSITSKNAGHTLKAGVDFDFYRTDLSSSGAGCYIDTTPNNGVINCNTAPFTNNYVHQVTNSGSTSTTVKVLYCGDGICACTETSANCLTDCYGTIQGYKVQNSNWNQTSTDWTTAKAQTITIDGIQLEPNTNPYFSSRLTTQTNHTVTTTVPPNYSAGYTLCYNNITCHNNTPTSGSSVTINIPTPNGYADLYWHYSPCPAEFDCLTLGCHTTDVAGKSNGACGTKTCPSNAPAAGTCPTTCHTNTQYVSNGACGQTTCPSNAPAAGTCPTTCHTNTQYVSNGACGQTTCPSNAPAATNCGTATCQTTTPTYYTGSSCSASACSNYNAFPTATIPACRTSNGSGYDGSSCNQTSYTANCSTSCNGAGSSCCAALPAAPTGLSPITGSVLRTAGNTTFSWDAVTGAAGYYFRIAPNIRVPGGTCGTDVYCSGLIASGPTTTHTLTAGTDYTWWVHNAIAANGSCGTAGPETSATLHVCSAMTPPASLSPSGIIDAGTRNITWSPVAEATGYYLRVDDLVDGCCDGTNDVVTGVLASTTTSYPYTFLVGHTYNIWVHEVVDNSPLCYSVERRSDGITVRPIPPQPTITVTPTCINTGYDGSGINITWTNNSPVTWADISTSSDFSTYYHKQITGSVAGAAGNTNGTGFNLSTGGGTALTYSPNTTYYVRLFDGQNISDPTNPASFTTPNYCTPTGTCNVSRTSITNFATDTTTYTATPSGGDGTYAYTWTFAGTLDDCIASSCTKHYSTPGTITGSLIISSAGLSSTITCPDVTVQQAAGPWIQAVGDVHSNTGITARGGP